MWKLSIRVLAIFAFSVICGFRVAHASNDPPPSGTCSTKEVSLLQASMLSTKAQVGTAETDPGPKEELPPPSDVTTRHCKSTGEVSPMNGGKGFSDEVCLELPESLIGASGPFKSLCKCGDDSDKLATIAAKACEGKNERQACTLDLTISHKIVGQNQTRTTVKGKEIKSVCDNGKCVPYFGLSCAGQPAGSRCTNTAPMDTVGAHPCPDDDNRWCSLENDYVIISLSRCVNNECQAGFNPEWTQQ